MYTYWHCPHCTVEARTVDSKIPMHRCKYGPAPGVMTPLLRKGERAKVEVVERQDFVGREKVFLDHNGRPIMSVVTTRDDGQDCTVFAPTATAEQE